MVNLLILITIVILGPVRLPLDAIVAHDIEVFSDTENPSDPPIDVNSEDLDDIQVEGSAKTGM